MVSSMMSEEELAQMQQSESIYFSTENISGKLTIMFSTKIFSAQTGLTGRLMGE